MQRIDNISKALEELNKTRDEARTPQSRLFHARMKAAIMRAIFDEPPSEKEENLEILCERLKQELEPETSDDPEDEMPKLI